MPRDLMALTENFNSILEIKRSQRRSSETVWLSALNDWKNLTKVIAEAYNYFIKESSVTSNVLKYTINDLNIEAILHRNFVSKDQLDN